MNLSSLRRPLLVAFALSLGVLAPQPALAAPPPSGLPAHAGLVGDHKVMKVGAKHVAGAAASAAGTPVSTSPMAFHGGQLPYTPDVIPTPKVYLDFWGAGWAGLASAQAYVTSFFTDVGGSSWAGVDTQYRGAGGATVANVSSLGAPPWNDTTDAIPSGIGSGSGAVDADLAGETAAALAHFDPLHNTLNSTNSLIVVMTPSGVAPYGFPGSAAANYCAFHSSYYPGSGTTIYPNVLLPYLPDVEAHTAYTCYDTYGSTGLSGFSIVGGHEFAEAVTDADGRFGWFDDTPDPRGTEIGDLCDLGHTGVSPADVTLSNGHAYYVQPLFSNADLGTGPCVFGHLQPLVASSPGPTPTPSGTGPYVPLATPVRILDTRTGVGGHPGQLQAGETFGVQIAGNPLDGIPSIGAGAAVINATVTGASGGSLLTLFPAGLSGVPTASNLNFGPGQQIANLATVQLGTGGSIDVYNNLGTVDVILDVEGYYRSAAGAAAGLYNPLGAPARILDTRTGQGGHQFQLGPQQGLVLHVAGASGEGGAAGVPASGAGAATFNLTAVNSSAQSVLSVIPADASPATQPNFSNVNFPAFKNVPNRVISALTPSGNVVIFNSQGFLDVIVDVTGWFTDGVHATTGYNFSAISPQRLVDTRLSTGPFGKEMGTVLSVPVPATARAIVANVTGIAPPRATFITVYPDNPSLYTPPATSDLNLNPGQNVPNLCIPAVNTTTHLIDLYNADGLVNVVVDLAGYFS